MSNCRMSRGPIRDLLIIYILVFADTSWYRRDHFAEEPHREPRRASPKAPARPLFCALGRRSRHNRNIMVRALSSPSHRDRARANTRLAFASARVSVARSRTSLTSRVPHRSRRLTRKNRWLPPSWRKSSPTCPTPARASTCSVSRTSSRRSTTRSWCVSLAPRRTPARPSAFGRRPNPRRRFPVKPSRTPL